MNNFSLIPFSEFERISIEVQDKYTKLSLIADMCRANALTSVKIAGSGHLGSSFSSLDIVTTLYHSEMNLKDKGPNNENRDIFFLQKDMMLQDSMQFFTHWAFLRKNSFSTLEELMDYAAIRTLAPPISRQIPDHWVWEFQKRKG
jgi:Transketolase, N-terminal subunit